MILTLDPFDTGRFAILPSRGVPDFGQRLAFASIARQLDVNTAIIGNSTIQLVDPARLSELSARKAVSLAVPGTGPLEQLAIADWFLRHHRNTPQLAMVIGIDSTWCTTEDPIPITNPFPFWLYSPSRLEYARNMMNYKSIEAALRKVKMLANLDRKARPDGYHDYDPGHPWHKPDFSSPISQGDFVLAQGESATDTDIGGSAASFTAAPLLRGFLRTLDGGVRVVLVVLPRHKSGLPPPGSAAGEKLDRCKAAYRALVQSRFGARFLDFLVDSEMVRTDENFWDKVHFRGPVARLVEDQLATALSATDSR